MIAVEDNKAMQLLPHLLSVVSFNSSSFKLASNLSFLIVMREVLIVYNIQISYYEHRMIDLKMTFVANILLSVYNVYRLIKQIYFNFFYGIIVD